MKKVLVTGAGGQLGSELVRYLEKRGYEVIGKTKAQMNITDRIDVETVVTQVAPDIVIHCAAYTNVDGAENNPDCAFLVNALGTCHIARASERAGAIFVYISSDYVFDGTSSIPYHEFSPVSPINLYGESKLAGELAVKEMHTQYFIVRTSWLFGRKGPNFVQTMLKLANEQPYLTVVDDQRGSPTYAGDLSEAVIQLIETNEFGTYHITNSGNCTWFEFAKEIFQETGMDVDLRPCTTDQFKRPAARPAYSVLDHMGMRLNGFPPMPHWREGLKKYLEDCSRWNHPSSS